MEVELFVFDFILADFDDFGIDSFGVFANDNVLGKG